MTLSEAIQQADIALVDDHTLHFSVDEQGDEYVLKGADEIYRLRPTDIHKGKPSMVVGEPCWWVQMRRQTDYDEEPPEMYALRLYEKKPLQPETPNHAKTD